MGRYALYDYGWSRGGLQGSDPQHFFYHYTKVHVSKGHVDTMARRINSEGVVVRIFDIIEDIVEDDLIGWGLLLAAGILLFTLGLSIS